MNKLLKRLSVVTLALMLVFSLAACGGDSGSGDDASKESKPAAQMTEDEYKAKVEEIYTNISTVSQEEMAAVDTTDLDATVKGMTAMVKKVRPMYEELGALNAPDSFKSSQDKIKSGAEASVELLDLSLEMFEMQANPPDAEKVTEKMQELTEKTTEFQTKAQELTTGLTEVIGTV